MSTNTNRGRECYKKARPLLMVLYYLLLIFPRWIRQVIFVGMRGLGGTIGIGFRYALIKSLAASCGDNVSIHANVFILHPENLHLGDNVSIHPMCYIECGENADGVRIDSDVSIAHSVSIVAATHNYANEQVPIKDQGITNKPIHICINNWIGAKATILAGVCIAEGCVIGANSVVTKDTIQDHIYGGTPAKIIKKRIS